jgi:hypothetical protein
MSRKVRVGQPFEDVEAIDARRRLKREHLIGALSILVVGFALASLGITGLYGLVTTDWVPIGAVHGYAIGAVAGILGAVIGAKPWFGDSS